MPLTRGRRTADTTRVTLDRALLARRLGLGAAFLGAAAGLCLGVGGLAWAPGALVALPGLFTLAAARRPFTAPCPACGCPLGASTLALPDDAVLARAARDVRCDACGVYVDASGGEVREVPFHRELDAPGYEAAFEADAALRWPARCARCQEPATRALRLTTAREGIASGEGATLDAAPGEGPGFCDRHGDELDPVARGVLVARAGGALTARWRLYAAYRAHLDDNRGAAEVRVRAMAEPEG